MHNHTHACMYTQGHVHMHAASTLILQPSARMKIAHLTYYSICSEIPLHVFGFPVRPTTRLNPIVNTIFKIFLKESANG